MKIILVNYRYFISGGPERYYFNIKEILERNGHVVIPFSVKNSRNFSSDYETYFLDRLDDEVYFAHSNKKSMKVILKSFSRMFYSFEAKRKFRQLLTQIPTWCISCNIITRYHLASLMRQKIWEYL